ncbi:hypothetical protein CEUSTIGMA_g13786.t1, partial [Chlamydomonas eustigma]
MSADRDLISAVKLPSLTTSNWVEWNLKFRQVCDLQEIKEENVFLRRVTSYWDLLQRPFSVISDTENSKRNERKLKAFILLHIDTASLGGYITQWEEEVEQEDERSGGTLNQAHLLWLRVQAHFRDRESAQELKCKVEVEVLIGSSGMTGHLHHLHNSSNLEDLHPSNNIGGSKRDHGGREETSLKWHLQEPAQPVAPGGGGGGPHGMAGLLVSVPNHQQDDHQQQQGASSASLSAFDRNDHQDAVTMPHVPPTKWIVDTGSTRSNTPYRELLHDYKPVQEKVWVVGGRTMAVAGVGTLHLDIKVGEEMHRLVVPGVNHVPGSVYNLLSRHDLHKERIATFCFKPDAEDGELRLPAGHGMNIGAHLVDVPWVEGSYQLTGQPVYPHVEYEEVSLVNRAAREQRAAQQLHEAMGHPSHEVLARGLEKGAVTGVNVNPAVVRGLPGCAECLQSKQTKSTFGESARSPVWKPGECLNIDLWGPARVAAWQGEEMFLGMKDSSSGFSIVSLIKSKEASEVVPKIIELQKFMERQSGNLTKVIRSDRGREFL